MPADEWEDWWPDGDVMGEDDPDNWESEADE